MTRRDLGLILVGALLVSGIFFIIVGFLYKDSLGDYIQAKYLPPIFNVPEEVNRDFAVDVIDRTNIERKKVNLSPLQENSALSYAAFLRAKEIINNQDFNHYASGSGDIKAQKAVEVVGYRYSEVGENLAKGFNDPNAVIEGWLNSLSHKENMLKSNYEEIGVAVLNGRFQGQDNINIVVQLFGKR